MMNKVITLLLLQLWGFWGFFVLIIKIKILINYQLIIKIETLSVTFSKLEHIICSLLYSLILCDIIIIVMIIIIIVCLEKNKTFGI